MQALCSASQTLPARPVCRGYVGGVGRLQSLWWPTGPSRAVTRVLPLLVGAPQGKSCPCSVWGVFLSLVGSWVPRLRGSLLACVSASQHPWGSFSFVSLNSAVLLRSFECSLRPCGLLQGTLLPLPHRGPSHRAWAGASASARRRCLAVGPASPLSS